MGLVQDPPDPYSQLRWRVGCWRWIWPSPRAVQTISRQQRADDQQRYPQGQVESTAGPVLSLDRIGVQHEHINQPDRQPQAHPAQQEAHEHRPWPLAPGQDQVNDEQLGVQRREASQPEEHRDVHRTPTRVSAMSPAIRGPPR